MHLALNRPICSSVADGAKANVRGIWGGESIANLGVAYAGLTDTMAVETE